MDGCLLAFFHQWQVVLSLVYVDAHCHLERRTYGDELAAVMARARAAGLRYFVAVGASGVSEGAREALTLAEAHGDVFCAVGVHPHEAAAALAEPTHMATIDALLAHPKAVALGEVGLDYYYEHSPRDAQRQAFRQFLHMAQKHHKPVMLHIRDAHKDCWQIIDEEGLPAPGGVIHCFTAGPDEAREYLERGFHLSIPGVVTFKNAEPLRQAIPQIPLDRLFLETDCPYLAPVPYRGKRNEPAYMVETAAAVGKLLGMSAQEVGDATTANAVRFFGLRDVPLDGD